MPHRHRTPLDFAATARGTFDLADADGVTLRHVFRALVNAYVEDLDNGRGRLAVVLDVRGRCGDVYVKLGPDVMDFYAGSGEGAVVLERRVCGAAV